MILRRFDGNEIRVELAEDGHTVQRLGGDDSVIESWDMKTEEGARWLMEQMAAGSFRFEDWPLPLPPKPISGG